jgi:hypothetical protein
MTTADFIARLIETGWYEDKTTRVRKYRVFGYQTSDNRILIGSRGAVRKAHRIHLSRSISIGSCGKTNPDNLWKRM